ncbi:MAG: ATP-dependent Clp protease ATP-binding subunit [Verrucomicrobia bacterium]|nr:ATP-dependent Clp protease ATP-binding subunit [Verrucomicrobiota bacterium]
MTRLIPVDLISRLNTLGDFLRSNIVGQEEVLEEIVPMLQGSFCEIRFPKRPITSMLFLGPTGVGKTETALLFTEHLFASSEKLVRLDMSEFMTPDSIGVLRGQNTSERGLFGHYYDRSRGSGTFLFDEIEKAHPLINDVFLQILSAARFTLATGETLDLSNYVVVATSNVGSRVLMESRSTDRETIVRRMIQAGTTDFRVETMGRFELQAIFNKLDYQSLQKIGALHTAKCLDLINAQGHSITIEPGVVEYVQREGYSERFGARPMQNAAMRVLKNIVTVEMLRNGGMPVLGRIEYDRRSNKCLIVNQ